LTGVRKTIKASHLIESAKGLPFCWTPHKRPFSTKHLEMLSKIQNYPIKGIPEVAKEGNPPRSKIKEERLGRLRSLSTGKTTA
jgi:hypothetical protein